MDLKEDAYLVRMTHAERESYRTENYGFDNRNRSYAGHCVIQRTLRGCAYLELRGRHYKVPKGSAMVFAHGEESSYGYASARGEEYGLEWLGFYGGNALQMLAAIRENLGTVFLLPEGSEPCLTFWALLKAAEENRIRDRFFIGGQVQLLLHQLLSLSRRSRRGRPVEEQAWETIQDEFAQGNNLTEIAQRLKCSREHLSRRFALRYGESPACALRRLRLEHAAELLEVSSLQIADVALRVGMQDVNTFYRAFRSRYSLSPSAYRERRKAQG